MVYSSTRISELKVDMTPSFLWSNLTTNSTHLAFSNRSTVVVCGVSCLSDLSTVAPSAKITPSPLSDGVVSSPSITHTALVTLDNGKFLVVTTPTTLVVYDGGSVGVESGSAAPPTPLLRQELAHLDAATLESRRVDSHFFRGVGGVPSLNTLLVGTSWGAILAWRVERRSSAGYALTHTYTIPGGSGGVGHGAPINCIHADEKFILSGDDMGVVCQWGVALLSGGEGGGGSSSKQTPPPLLAKYSSSSSAPIPLSTATSTSSSSSKSGGVPCTAIGIVAGVAGVAGYADGRVRVYMLGSGGVAEGGSTTTASATTGRFLEGEAGGHSGAVTGLALHPRLPAFATCGQDGVVCVWSLPELAGVKAGMGGGGGGASGAGGPKSTGKLVLDFCHRVSKTAVLTGVGFAPAPGNSSNAYHLLATSYDTPTLTVFLSL